VLEGVAVILRSTRTSNPQKLVKNLGHILDKIVFIIKKTLFITYSKHKNMNVQIALKNELMF